MNEEVSHDRLGVVRTRRGAERESWDDPTVDEDPVQDPELDAFAYAPPPAHGFAVASLVFGVLGLLGLFGIGPLFALFFGYVGRARIKRRLWGGDGLAVAGIVLGWIGLFVMFALILVFGLFGPTLSIDL